MRSALTTTIKLQCKESLIGINSILELNMTRDLIHLSVIFKNSCTLELFANSESLT